MARIAGVDIPRDKRTVISLTYIYGVGPTKAKQACEATGIDESVRVKDLTEADVNKLRAYIDQNITVEGDLRRDVAQDIKRKMEINCLQGVVTARVCLFVDSAPAQMLVPVRDQSAQSLVRRRSLSNGNR